MILSGTGHRPDKLGFGKQGYQLWVLDRLLALATDVLTSRAPIEMVISGMALGWDQALAKAAINLGIPLMAAIPFAGQERRWPETSKDTYHKLLEQATQLVVVSENVNVSNIFRVATAMQRRNEWMVDHCHLLVTLWDGEESGGTWNCVRYAKKQQRAMLHCWDAWQRRTR